MLDDQRKLETHCEYDLTALTPILTWIEEEERGGERKRETERDRQREK